MTNFNKNYYYYDKNNKNNMNKVRNKYETKKIPLIYKELKKYYFQETKLLCISL